MSVPFTIRSAGRRFEGRYRVEGHHLEVMTAYGARRAPIGLERPLKLAKALYRVILRDVADTLATTSARASQHRQSSTSSRQTPGL